MAHLQITLQNPAGTIYDITDKVLFKNSETDISLQVEEDTNSFTCGDLTLSVDDKAGYFTGLFGSLPLDGEAKWDYATSKGTWYLCIYKDGTLRWSGDLDPSQIFGFGSSEKVIVFTAIGVLKRAENYRADDPVTGCLRTFPDPLLLTTVRNGRKITFPNLVSSYNFEVGDRIKCSALNLNGNIIDQEFEVRLLSDSTLTAYQIKARQGAKRVYTEGWVINPWYRGDTVAVNVARLFAVMGMTASDYTISGTSTSWIVDELNVEDKTVKEVLVDLAKYAGCVIYTQGNHWYFVDRLYSSAGSPKAIDTLIKRSTWNAQALDEKYYLSIKVTGTAPYFAPDSTPRAYRIGKFCGGDRSMDLETKFTSDLTTLQTIAEGLWERFAYRRALVDVQVMDDGHKYDLWEVITVNGEQWRVIGYEEPVRSATNVSIGGVDVPIRDVITLHLQQVVGVAPSAADYAAFPNYRDTDPPYPPDVVELSSGKKSKRKSWWSTFRALHPDSDVPLKIWKEIKPDGDDDSAYMQQFILWAVRFTWPWGADAEDTPDGFELTVFKDGETPDNAQQGEHYVRHHKGLRQPLPDETAPTAKDGYYYMWFYKPMLEAGTAPVWNVVLRTWDARTGLSAYSDEATTSDDIDTPEEPDQYPPCVLYGIKQSSGTAKMLRYTPSLDTWENITFTSATPTADGLHYILYDNIHNRIWARCEAPSGTWSIIYSDDRGDNWTAITLPSGYTLIGDTARMGLSRGTGRIYFWCLYTPPAPDEYRLCYIDYGGSMVDTGYVSGSGLYTTISYIFCDPLNAERLWLYDNGTDKLGFSSDSGATFTNHIITVSGTTYRAGMIVPSNTFGKLWAVEYQGDQILVSTDNGATWALSGSAFGAYLDDLWEDSFNLAILYVGGRTTDGTWCIWKSTDTGANWTKISGTLSTGDDYQCYKIVGDKLTQNSFVGYGYNLTDSKHSLFYTTDGATWAEKIVDETLYSNVALPSNGFNFLLAMIGLTSAPPPPPQDKEPIYCLCRNLSGGATEKRRIYRTRDNGFSFDKIWADETDIAATPHCFIEPDFLNNTRIYRLAEGPMAKYSDTGGLTSEKAGVDSFTWYKFFEPNTGMSFWKVQLAVTDNCAYLCDGYNVWRTLDRTASTLIWAKIWAWGGTEANRIYSIAIDKDNDGLYAIAKDGKVYYTANPYSAASWDGGNASGFGSAEAVDIIVSLNKVYAIGNNASFKIRRADKTDLTTWATVTAPTGIGNMELNGFFVDDFDEDYCLIMSRNATDGLWGSVDLTNDDSPTWTSISGDPYRCACPISSANHNYLVAGNGVLSIVVYTGSVWTLTASGISDIIDDLANKNFMAIGTARTYFPVNTSQFLRR